MKGPVAALVPDPLHYWSPQFQCPLSRVQLLKPAVFVRLAQLNWKGGGAAAPAWNHRMAWVGSDLKNNPFPTTYCLLNQAQDQAAQGCIQITFMGFAKWRSWAVTHCLTQCTNSLPRAHGVRIFVCINPCSPSSLCMSVQPWCCL